MALFFILFIPFTFICVMVIKSSMNYEFGSDRRKRTVRLSVVAATLRGSNRPFHHGNRPHGIHLDRPN